MKSSIPIPGCAVLAVLMSTPAAAQYVDPIGIPTPSFGTTERAPSRPEPWSAPVERYYYVEHRAGCAIDTNGTPAAPRCTIPTTLEAGSVVELHGSYPTAHTNGDRIVMNGTAEAPVYIRGRDETSRPTITQPWEVRGTYAVLEHLEFAAAAGTGRWQLVVSRQTSHLAVRHNELHGTPSSGGLGVFDADGTGGQPLNNVVVWDNRIHDNGNLAAPDDNPANGADYHGVNIACADHVWVVGNELAANSGDGVQINGGRSGQACTNHIYLGLNVAHGNRQTGLWTKQAVDVVFSQNRVYDHRPAKGSGVGACVGGQYAPDYVWFLFNDLHDCELGILMASDSDLGTGTRLFAIGNVIHAITDSDGSFDAANGYTDCGIALWGGVNRYVLQNTLYDVPSGICSPAQQGLLSVWNNVIDTLNQADGFHILFPGAGYAWRGAANLFAPNRRLSIAGRETTAKPPLEDALGKVVAAAGFRDAAKADFALAEGSPAIDLIASPAIDSLYAAYEERYGVGIRRDAGGRARPVKRYDAGAYEWPDGTERGAAR
ncbi:MAG: right-handed parallel beta-helix repeat-containing protein [Acidobacteria bacterium]|nr:right-handed parallel beta-helix repeat-containing protein [Acidobacteriota bacterium]